MVPVWVLPSHRAPCRAGLAAVSGGYPLVLPLSLSLPWLHLGWSQLNYATTAIASLVALALTHSLSTSVSSTSTNIRIAGLAKQLEA